MSRRDQLKTLVLLLGAQAVCLGIGFWILHRYNMALVERVGREEAYSQLADLAQNMAAPLEAMPTQPSPREVDLRRIRRSLSGATATVRGHAVLVDGKWRVLVGHDHIDNDTRLQWSPRDRSQGATAKPSGNAPISGSLELPDGRHLAVAFPLSASNGHLVVHRSTDDLSVSPASIDRSLFNAGLIVFAGTTGLFSFAAYLVFSQVWERFSHKLAESEAAGTKKTESLVRMRDAIIFGLADLAESRDTETGHHLERISVYSSTMARALRRHPDFRSAISPEFVKTIGLSSILHDIGKVGIEDEVLLKPGRLTDEEVKRMQRHASLGGKLIEKIEQRLGSANFLRTAREIAYCHHERWDGTGYPNGMAGEDIPLAARIVALCDVYEALSSKRVYKPAWPHEKCVAHIRKEAGKHFDPQMVAVFLAIEKQFHNLARQYGSDPFPKDNTEAGQQDQDEVTSAEASIYSHDASSTPATAEV